MSDEESIFVKVPRPEVLAGVTVKVRTSCGNMYVQMNWYKDKLFEVFATLGHSGGCAACQSEALTRSITLGLRYGLPYEEYFNELRGIQCPNPVLFPKKDRVRSCPDAIGKVLEKYGKLSTDEIVKLFHESNGGSAKTSEKVEVEEAAEAAAVIERLREDRGRLDL